MDPQTLHTIEVAEEAATQLIDACRRNSPLYRQSPRVVAQVSRTGKWLLNALANLRRAVNVPSTEDNQQS